MAVCFLLASLPTQADPISFPSSLVPFTSIAFTSTPDSNGILLVMGYSTFPAFAILRSLPAPASGQQFSDSSVELAPGQFFSHVYVPTEAELAGNFQDFGGTILDPLSNGQVFPGNLIPEDLLGGIYAFRVEADATLIPEPQPLYTLCLFAGLAGAQILRRRSIFEDQTAVEDEGLPQQN